MTMLLFKALAGALIVLAIGLLSGGRYYYIAGLLPLFPTFTLISHLMIASERSHAELKTTMLFSLWSLIPYVMYLISSYLLIDRMRLGMALGCSVLVWFAAAGVLLKLWVTLR